MTVTILYADAMYVDEALEQEVFGPDVRIIMAKRGGGHEPDSVDDLSDADCAAADGLMIFRHFLTAAHLARFPRLRAVVRMGVGYDRLDRVALAARGITMCNVPDYGTTEVADHAIALALGLRRGLFLYHEAQRMPGAEWQVIEHPLIRRLGVQRFGIVGLGRIGTAVALRAKALGFDVAFHDPNLANGVDRALGITRCASLDALLARSDVLSLHAPLTPATRGLIGVRELALLPPGAVLINTARGPIVDLEALTDALRSGHLAGAGLDVVPVEPPVEPLPELLRAYRGREAWLQGRLVVTPHSAFHSPQAWADIRRKAAETMVAVLLTNTPQNVITPEMF